MEWEREGVWGERLRSEKLLGPAKMKMVDILCQTHARNGLVARRKIGDLAPSGVQWFSKYGPLEIPSWAVLGTQFWQRHAMLERGAVFMFFSPKLGPWPPISKNIGIPFPVWMQRSPGCTGGDWFDFFKKCMPSHAKGRGTPAGTLSQMRGICHS